METMCSWIVKATVACNGERLKVIADFHPFDALTIITADTQANRGDTTDTDTSTRHSEDVYTAMKEKRCDIDEQYRCTFA